jgi:hypothetical protein
MQSAAFGSRRQIVVQSEGRPGSATSRGHVGTFDKAGEFAWRERNSHKTVAVARPLFTRCVLCDEVIAVDGALPRATGRVKFMGDQLVHDLRTERAATQMSPAQLIHMTALL